MNEKRERQHEVDTITRTELEERLSRQEPDNDDPRSGWALVNVLDPEAFERAHIPGSINIPADRIERFEERFGHDKEIVVYCASPDCQASPRAAAELARRGFTEVVDYEAGMSQWRAASNPVERTAA